MGNPRVAYLTRAAAVAAMYVVLTYLANAMGLASGTVQLRLSEALTVLPALMPAAIPGLFAGCLLANLLTGCLFLDIVFGSLATLAGALGTWALRGAMRQRGNRPHVFNDRLYLAGLPPVIANMIAVPFILRHVYGVPGPLWYFALTVGAGELMACVGLGTALLAALRRRPGLLSRVLGP